MAEFQIKSTPEETLPSPTIPGGHIVRSKNKTSLGAILAWGAVFALLILLAFGLINAQRGPVGEGETIPNFTLTTYDGKQISLEELKGQVVVVNFWASWCKPCEQEAAELEAAWRYYQPGGEVVFLGVNYVDTESEALAYLKRFNITYPNAPDLEMRLSQAFRIRGVPETYFISREGVLAATPKIGPFVSVGEIWGMVDQLLQP